MVNVKFKFDIEEKVKVKEINVTGRVVSLLKDISGMQYQIVYWYNGDRKVIWSHEWELEVPTIDDKKISLGK